jgi:chromosomal replication initiator protein
MNTDYHQIWNDCLTVIKDNVQPLSFRTWFEPIKPLRIEGEILTIQVPSPFFYEYLEEQYIDILRKTLRKVIGKNAKLEYNVVMSDQQHDSNSQTVNYPTNNNLKLNNRPISAPLRTDANTIKNPFD